MAKQKNECDLSTCLLCRLCIKEWLPAIGAQRSNIAFKKGERLFSEGEEMKGMYFIYSGTAKVHMQWGKEKELIVRFARKGDIIGHRGLGTDTIYPVSGTALEPVTACFISLDFFHATLKVNPAFTDQLLHFYAQELKESERNMRNLAHMPVKGRVANALLQLQRKFGNSPEGHINILLSRQDLASYAGTTYETVFRIMNELAQDEAIRADGKEITILSQIKLQELTSIV
ncbi:MAG: Crp/Fnr family transcriptional regulator [Bacteroidetes bacterium]|nr:Crp/Fnr family transcriptional regulator [Bacteroidota bacterium]